MNIADKIKTNELLSIGYDLINDIQKRFPDSDSYLVGGTIRDVIMGIEPHDVDIATNVPLSLIEEKYPSHDIGKSKDFGISVIHFEGHIFEVANFREDLQSSNNRHPDGVKIVNNFKADTARRDITINSLGCDVDGNIVDHQGGISDIENKIVRAVGIADNRFKEDGLRILRVARFSAKFNFHINVNTEIAMANNSHLISKISKERIRDELFKSATSGECLARFIAILEMTGIIDYCFPEIKEFHLYEHTEESHPEGNLSCHTLEALKQSSSCDPATNIAILYHDIGKTVCRSYNEEGRVQYKGHEKESGTIFEEIGKNLKFSTDQIDSIKFAIENHMIGHNIEKLKKSKLVRIRQDINYGMLKEVILADEKSRLHLFNEDSFNKKMEKVEEVYKIFGEKTAFEERMKPLINGRMIIDFANDKGVKLQGKDIGAIKNIVREKIIEKNFNITKEEINIIMENSIKELDIG